MSHRSSKALLFVLTVIALGVIGLVAWMQSRSTEHSFEPTEVVLAEETPRPAANSELTAPRAEQTSRPASNEPRAEVSTALERELAEATWVTGRVVFPEDMPINESVDVVATGKNFKHGDDHRVRVAADGSFRVAFRKDTKYGSLDIDAPHLYLAAPLRVKLPAKEPLTLEPNVGARIQGRVVAPLGAEKPEETLRGKSVKFSGWSRSFGSLVQRTGEIDADLRFELRGIPPHLDGWLQCDPFIWPSISRQHGPLKPGADVELELTFELGVSVSGVARDEQGQPVASANINVTSTVTENEGSSDGHASTTTKVDGTFQLRGISAGKLNVEVQKQGFLPAKLDLGDVANGEQRTDVELVLPSGFFVAGKVTWPDGTPAANASITVEQPPSDDESMISFQMFGGANAKCDVNGAFRVSGLGPGPYKLTATAKRARDDEDDTAAKSSADKSTTTAPRWTVTVEDVAANTSEVKLALESGFSVAGFVTDDLGAPIERFTISTTAIDPENPWMARVGGSAIRRFRNKDGSFVLEGLLEGTSRLRASAIGYAPTNAIRVDVPGATSALRIVLPRASEIAGRVLDPDGKPVHKATVEIERKDIDEENDDVYVAPITSTTNDKGIFKFNRAPVGSVVLTAELPGFAPGAPLALNLAPGSSVEGIELRLSRGGRLTGEIRTGVAASTERWRVHVYSSDGGGWKSAESDARGRFTIEALAAGRYQLSAEAIETDDSAESEAHRAQAEFSKSVDIVDGQTTHVLLGGEPKDFVAVSGVVRSGTRGVADANIRAMHFSTDGDHFSANTVTDAQGRYSLELPAKELSFSVEAGGATISRQVTVRPGAAQTEDFELGTGKLRGRVVSREGDPLSEVRVSAALDSSERALRREGLYGEATTRDDGTFEIDNLGAGTYSLTAPDRSTFRIPDHVVALGSVTRRGVVLGAGATVDGLELVLDKAGTLVGRVTDTAGQPVQSTFVRLSDESGATLENAVARTNESGEFEAEGLAPGRYAAQAFSGQLLSDRSDLVRVEAGGRANVDLVLKAGGHVRVFVEDSNGVLVGASIEVVDARGRVVGARPFGFEAPSSDQSQSAGPLAPGTYQITATNHDRVSASATVDVKAGTTNEVRIRLGGD